MDILNPKASKEPRFPKAVVPSAKGISPPATYDNMVQERYIHSRGRFPELPSELNIRRAG
jgi:hypothetical protein